MYCLFDQSGRKETVLDLAKFVDKGVQVKLTGGRQGLYNFTYLKFPAMSFIQLWNYCMRKLLWILFCLWIFPHLFYLFMPSLLWHYSDIDIFNLHKISSVGLPPSEYVGFFSFKYLVAPVLVWIDYLKMPIDPLCRALFIKVVFFFFSWNCVIAVVSVCIL